MEPFCQRTKGLRSTGRISWQTKDRVIFFSVNLLKNKTVTETMLEIKVYRACSALFVFTED